MENVYTIPADSYNNQLASVITDYQAAEQFESDKWGDACRIAAESGCYSKEEWKEFYQQAEEEQAAARERTGETIARTKAGKVIASKAFPKTWNTDKAIIGKAIDAGADLIDSDGNPIPKDKVQAAYKAEPSDKSDFDKILTTINTYKALYHKLDADEQITVRQLIDAVHGE